MNIPKEYTQGGYIQFFSCTYHREKYRITKRKYKGKLTRKALVVYFANTMFSKKDYTYHLPEELIAQEAVHPHHNARIIIIDRESGTIDAEDIFWNLDAHLDKRRVFFFNNSKVLRSRIPLKNTPIQRIDGSTGMISSGEIFFLKNRDNAEFEALVHPGNKFKIGTKIFIGDSIITVVQKTDSWRVLSITGESIFHLMEHSGNLPLPPYIAYEKEKEADYQTSFASKEGSVAAPTASLHFTKELLDKIPNRKYYTTLHVWLGTFKGIDTDDVREYAIHEERAEVEFGIFDAIAIEKNKGNRIISVGTTVCRTLESLPFVWKLLDTSLQKRFPEETQHYWNQLSMNIASTSWIQSIDANTDEQLLSFSTAIYILPWHAFLVIDELITNFHLPESSLLVLVSALIGNTETLSIYQQAIKKGYRFYSFWDGIYIRWK